MGKPVILDLFCGAGGAAMGYYRAGFDVIGVDINDQPHYPFRFVRGDAMTYPLDGVDAIHASPPCQRYSKMCRAMGLAKSHPDLVAAVRERLHDADLPFVIENVPGAPLCNPIVLCGSMFDLRSSTGLWLRRHRWFELSWVVLGVPECRHSTSPSIGVYGNGTNSFHRRAIGRNITAEECREAMGIDWMTRRELSQAIPPAYTKWIGAALRRKFG